MTDEPLDDPLIQMQAELDQAMSYAPMVAQTARAMFNAFEAEGFADSQALYLTACQILSKPGYAP